MGDVGESLIGLVGSPVWSFQSSSSLVLLSLFFSWVSFSTYSWRLAFSSDSCLRGEEEDTVKQQPCQSPELGAEGAGPRQPVPRGEHGPVGPSSCTTVLEP